MKFILKKIKKMHDLGIVHRDLHSENIMINPRPNDISIKDIRIIDFGEAKYMSDLRDKTSSILMDAALLDIAKVESMF